MMGEVNEEVRKAVEIINRNARHLLKLATDVMDISKIELGEVKAEEVECDLEELIEEAIETIAPMAEGKGLEVRSRVDPSLKVIRTDPEKVRRILLNLLSNAVKFTERGYVEVRCGPSEEGEWVEISVRDTGVGIREEDLPKLFQDFVQLRPGTEGHGLGLSISKRLAALLGGDIEVESEPGVGSRFTLKIPFKRSEG
ncbi:hypothetical protein DRP77_08580 [Candidatus Poribacteria bacterium]|nr:MAG: hypothetical protein DRP77_08580 [Candidatus Poribacteria bacterium]